MESPQTTLTESIAQALKTSEFDCSMWPIETLRELAAEVIIAIYKDGWRVKKDTECNP